MREPRSGNPYTGYLLCWRLGEHRRRDGTGPCRRATPSSTRPRQPPTPADRDRRRTGDRTTARTPNQSCGVWTVRNHDQPSPRSSQDAGPGRWRTTTPARSRTRDLLRANGRLPATDQGRFLPRWRLRTSTNRPRRRLNDHGTGGTVDVGDHDEATSRSPFRRTTQGITIKLRNHRPESSSTGPRMPGRSRCVEDRMTRVHSLRSGQVRSMATRSGAGPWVMTRAHARGQRQPPPS